MRHLLCIVILGLALASAQAAEEDFVLLNVKGDLIGPIEENAKMPVDRQQAARLIEAYHQQLGSQFKAEVETLHAQLLTFIPGFEVAYTAADSAEIAHIMSEIDLRLAALQTIHVQNYTQDVVGLLTEAYQLILPTFGDEH